MSAPSAIAATTLRPDSPDQLVEAVRWAAAEQQPLRLTAGGTKEPLGRPVAADTRLDLSGLAGIVAYEPEELVLTARAGTPLAEIQALLAGRGQMLAFEPPDWTGLLGSTGAATLGGVVSANLSGPRRLRAGAARDHMLGVQAVSGRGEAFKAGGRVVKNVTGYDLPKLLAGAHGTLAALAEVTVKVLPAPPACRTLLLLGLDDGAAMRALATALSSPAEVSGAAHLPVDVPAPDLQDGLAATLLRVEGVGPSVADRLAQLTRLLAPFGGCSEVDDVRSRALWRAIGDVAPLAGGPEPIIWRLSVPPAAAPALAARLRAEVGGRLFYDWGGGLVWLALPSSDALGPDAAAGRVRAALGGQGHATLVRAPAELRHTVPVFQPQPAPLAALTRRVKTQFDPLNILNPGRMYPEQP